MKKHSRGLQALASVLVIVQFSGQLVQQSAHVIEVVYEKLVPTDPVTFAQVEALRDYPATKPANPPDKP